MLLVIVLQPLEKKLLRDDAAIEKQQKIDYVWALNEVKTWFFILRCNILSKVTWEIFKLPFFGREYKLWYFMRGCDEWLVRKNVTFKIGQLIFEWVENFFKGIYLKLIRVLDMNQFTVYFYFFAEILSHFYVFAQTPPNIWIKLSKKIPSNGANKFHSFNSITLCLLKLLIFCLHMSSFKICEKWLPEKNSVTHNIDF